MGDNGDNEGSKIKDFFINAVIGFLVILLLTGLIGFAVGLVR